VVLNLELEHEAPAGAACLEHAMCLGGSLGRYWPSVPERELAVLDLLTEPIELGLLTHIATDEYG
jgi:hypothetical protein